MPDRPPIAAFYSYKGGVGRTTTLANVGYLFAQEGKRVFLWDFDLDTPNLHSLVTAMGADSAQRPGLGLTDYLVKWQRSGEAPTSLEPYLWSFPVGERGGQVDSGRRLRRRLQLRQEARPARLDPLLPARWRRPVASPPGPGAGA